MMPPGWALWIILGLLAMAMEILLPGVFLLWAGLAAVGTGLLVLLADPGAVATVLGFLLLLGLGIGLSLRVFRPRRGRMAVNTPASGLVGRQGLWLGAGRARIGDSDWPAHGGEALPPGSPVQVSAVEGLTLQVRPLPDSPSSPPG